jgi:putative ABC transport system permease protein
VSLALDPRRTDLRAGGGGLPARRAVVRWAWRLFRREWRQQLQILALLTAAIGAAIFSATAAYNLAPSRDAEFGTAERLIRLGPSDPESLQADLAALDEWFFAAEAIGHQALPVPGSIDTIDLRTQDPNGALGAPMLTLRTGTYPTTSNEIAVTDGAAQSFGVQIGDSLDLGGAARSVVGLVENPADLDDEFVLAPPDGAQPESVTILLGAVRDLENEPAALLPSGQPLRTEGRGQTERTTAAALVLVLATVVLLLICLVATAAFAVIAQRRQRQLGLLAAIGATTRHLRLVVLANGVAVGIVAAVTGTTIALLGWISTAPRMESAVGHRIDRFGLPWWLLGAGVVLGVTTATGAAWWPARTVARIPITQALSARPPRPKSSHRSAVAAAVLLGTGFACVALGVDTVKDRANPPVLMAGTVALVVGILFLSPLAIRVLASTAPRLPIAVRLALRDLARHQARSGAALAAISLGVGIAVATVVLATTSQHSAAEGNLSSRQLLVRVGNATQNQPVIPEITDAELRRLQTEVDGLAATLHDAAVIPLDAAVDPNVEETQGGQVLLPTVQLARAVDEHTLRDVGRLFVATPELLDHLGLDANVATPDVDVLTPQTGELFYAGVRSTANGRISPRTQSIGAPAYSSAPTSLITLDGLDREGWVAAPVGWLVETDAPLTQAELSAAREMAAAAGLSVEARDRQDSLATTRSMATAGGMLLALCILAMTVGLIRSEAGRDLQTLTAAGATSATRRTLSAATAGGLAMLGAGLGTAGAYLALVAGSLHDLGRLSPAPIAHLGMILVGLPLVAAGAGWLLAGREPTSLGGHALD